MPQRRRELCRALAEAKAAGRTTADVATDAHIARATLSRIANGHRTPNRLTRESIARARPRAGRALPRSRACCRASVRGVSALAGTTWVRRLARSENALSRKGVAVAHALADHADGEGRCKLLQQTIAREARISERAVRDGLSELRAANALQSRRTRGARCSCS